MYIDKLEGETLKKKQEYRNQASSNEYIQAFVAMLCDPRARDRAVIFHQLDHLNDVALDALSMPWTGVRAWSNFVFDAIEKNRFTWADTQDIQNHRFRLSLSQNRSKDHDSSHWTDRHSGATRESICMDFNAGHCSTGGFKRHHTEGTVRLVHWCSYCLAADGIRSDNHGTSSCRKKQRNAVILAASQAPQQFQPSIYQHPNHQARQ